MDIAMLALLTVLVPWAIGVCVGLLLLSWVVRLGVSRGLRDHQKWMETTRRTHWPVSEDRVYGPARPTIGEYFGFSERAAVPDKRAS
jgi:hypothetical protein